LKRYSRHAEKKREYILSAHKFLVMTKLRKIIIKVSILILSLPITILETNSKDVNAEESKGFYITGNYGSSSITKADWKATISNIDYKGNLQFKDGSGWESGMGYDFGTLRTELTYSQSINDIKSITAQVNEGAYKGTSASATASGDLKITNIFINSYLDFPIGKEKKFTSYIGGGIGGSKIDIDNIMVVNEEIQAASTWLFGYQGKFGLSYSISKNLNIFGEGISSKFSDLGAAGEKYGLESDSAFSYRGGFRLNF